MRTKKLCFPRLPSAALAASVAVLMFPSAGYAQLPDAQLPIIAFDSGGKTHYDSAQQLVSVDASAISILLPGDLPPVAISAAQGTVGSPGCIPLNCGTFTIRARVNNAGALAGGIAGPDLTIVGRVVGLDGVTVADGVLLSGDVKEFYIDGLFEGGTQFEFRFSITGGLLKDLGFFNQCGDWGTSLCDFGAPVEITLPAGSTAPPFDGSFTGNFDGGASGAAGAIQPMGSLSFLDHCTGRIGDTVWNDLDHDGIQDLNEPGLQGFAVALTGGPDSIAMATNTDADGRYLFGDLCAGPYHVQVSPMEYTPSAASSADVLLGVAANNLDVDFGLYLPQLPPEKPFFTVTQGGFGSKPSGSNPGRLLADNFGLLYPGSAVVIGEIGSTCANGAPYRIRLTSAAAIENLLPQGGKPARLAGCDVNPTTKVSILAGHVLALRLNVDFSEAGVTRPGLATLVVASGALAGWTVQTVLDAGNIALGGGALPAGVTLSQLSDVLAHINENFDGGTVDHGYLN